MYVILVYDVEARRTPKLLKLCRQYLHWIQNSVFEGELRPSQLEELLSRARDLMADQDSLIIFKSRQEKWLEKEIIGEERASTDNML
jgi:CRISPR-associated protein Cas2